MKDRCKIEARLTDLRRLYDEADSRKESREEPRYFSKLAIIELCGWFEQFADELVLEIVRGKVKEAKVVREFNKKLVRRVHGVHYMNDFRRLLQAALGEIVVHDIECAMGVKRDMLEGQLNDLYESRNTLAHTFIGETTPHIEAPSFTLNRFYEISECLNVLEDEICKRVQWASEPEYQI